MKRFLLLLFIIGAGACSKDNSTEGGMNAKLTETLAGKGWMITSFVLTTDDGGFVDLFRINFKECERDDILRFNAGGAFSLENNLNVCPPPGGSTVFANLNGGVWASRDSDSSLAIGKGFNLQEFKVTQWNASTMTWKQTSTNYLGIKEILTYKLVKN